MFDDYTLDKVLQKIKRIETEKPDGTKILTDTVDKFPNYILLKNAIIWRTCVIKDDDKFYPNYF